MTSERRRKRKGNHTSLGLSSSFFLPPHFTCYTTVNHRIHLLKVTQLTWDHRKGGNFSLTSLLLGPKKNLDDGDVLWTEKNPRAVGFPELLQISRGNHCSCTRLIFNLNRLTELLREDFGQDSTGPVFHWL